MKNALIIDVKIGHYVSLNDLTLTLRAVHPNKHVVAELLLFNGKNKLKGVYVNHKGQIFYALQNAETAYAIAKKIDAYVHKIVKQSLMIQQIQTI